MRTFFRDNGLTIALVAMFLFSAIGMIWSGHATYNEELRHHGAPGVGVLAYLASGDFLSALFEKVGERISANVSLCDADGHAVPARIGRVP